MTSHSGKGIPEEKIAGVLARAAELDRQLVSVDVLRSAALEAGIGTDAVNQAIAEYEAGVNRVAVTGAVAPKTAVGWRRFLRKAWPVAKLAAIALVLGAVAGGADRLILVSVLASIGITAYLARGTRHDEVRDFQLKSTVLTVAMTIGLQLITRDGEVLSLLAVLGILQLLFGTLFIVTRDHDDAGAVEVNASPS